MMRWERSTRVRRSFPFFSNDRVRSLYATSVFGPALFVVRAAFRSNDALQLTLALLMLLVGAAACALLLASNWNWAGVRRTIWSYHFLAAAVTGCVNFGFDVAAVRSVAPQSVALFMMTTVPLLGLGCRVVHYKFVLLFTVGSLAAGFASLAVDMLTEEDTQVFRIGSVAYTKFAIRRSFLVTLASALGMVSLHALRAHNRATNVCAMVSAKHSDVLAEVLLGIRARSLTLLRAAVDVREAEQHRPGQELEVDLVQVDLARLYVRGGAGAQVAASTEPSATGSNPGFSPTAQVHTHDARDARDPTRSTAASQRDTPTPPSPPPPQTCSTLATRRWILAHQVWPSILSLQEGRLLGSADTQLYTCAWRIAHCVTQTPVLDVVVLPPRYTTYIRSAATFAIVAACVYVVQVFVPGLSVVSGVVVGPVIIVCVWLAFYKNTSTQLARQAAALPASVVTLLWVSVVLATDVYTIVREREGVGRVSYLLFSLAFAVYMVGVVLLPALVWRSPRVEAIITCAGFATQALNVFLETFTATAPQPLLRLPHGALVTLQDVRRTAYMQTSLCLLRLTVNALREWRRYAKAASSGQHGGGRVLRSFVNGAFTVGYPIPERLDDMVVRVVGDMLLSAQSRRAVVGVLVSEEDAQEFEVLVGSRTQGRRSR